MRTLIADPIDQDAIDLLTKAGIELDNKPDITSEELIKTIENYDGLIVRGRTKVTRDVIYHANDRLKFIGRVGSGLDNIDLNSAKEKNITISNAPGANSTAVAELTIGLMLSLLRHIPKAHISTKNGHWEKKQLKGSEISGKKIGIVGFGNIGKKVANLVKAFGAEILSHDKDDNRDNLEKLFKRSDIITVHSVLVDQTRNLIDKSLLSLMKPTAYLLNCARAEIIVEDDLYQTLFNRKIAGAALDVFWAEPIPENSPWLSLENLILTPHIGGQTKEASQEAAKMVAENLISFIKNQSSK